VARTGCSGLVVANAHGKRGSLVGTRYCACVRTRFGVQEGTVLLYAHTHICTYAHPVNTQPQASVPQQLLHIYPHFRIRRISLRLLQASSKLSARARTRRKLSARARTRRTSATANNRQQLPTTANNNNNNNNNNNRALGTMHVAVQNPQTGVLVVVLP
jgi:hypothetical protein